MEVGLQASGLDGDIPRSSVICKDPVVAGSHASESGMVSGGCRPHSSPQVNSPGIICHLSLSVSQIAATKSRARLVVRSDDQFPRYWAGKATMSMPPLGTRAVFRTEPCWRWRPHSAAAVLVRRNLPLAGHDDGLDCGCTGDGKGPNGKLQTCVLIGNERILAH